MAKKLNHHLLKRGDTYYLQIVVNGLRVREALSKDATEARNLRDQIIPDLRWGRPRQYARRRMFFGEVAQRWIKVEEMRLKPSTLKDYKSIMNYHVLPRFGNWFIDEIKPVDIEEFMATRDCGPKRVNNILVPVRSLFRMAMKNGFVERNVSRMWRIYRSTSPRLARFPWTR